MPDVVFLDHNMPEYDGTYALEQIRKIESNALVVFITADLELGNKQKIIDLKPSAIIYKPFRITEILKILDKILPNKIITHE